MSLMACNEEFAKETADELWPQSSREERFAQMNDPRRDSFDSMSHY